MAITAQNLKPRAILFFFLLFVLSGCGGGKKGGNTDKTSWTSASIIFLHHSTGQYVWNEGVAEWFTDYNSANGTNY